MIGMKSVKETIFLQIIYYLQNFHANKNCEYLHTVIYGEPGCGKTSCIKAIANYTKRHVVEINLKNIKTCKDFINTFNAEYICDNYTPHKKKIIILEDIDCMIDIVKSRKD